MKGDKVIKPCVQRTSINTAKLLKQTPHPSNDLAWIDRESKKLFLPHTLPPQIAKMNTRMKFSDAICLRKICEHIRHQHWAHICEKKIEYREKVWEHMHVERVPCGRLRESFVDAFNTYVPYRSYLPIVHDLSS